MINHNYIYIYKIIYLSMKIIVLIAQQSIVKLLKYTEKKFLARDTAVVSAHGSRRTIVYCLGTRIREAAASARKRTPLFRYSGFLARVKASSSCYVSASSWLIGDVSRAG